MQRDWDSFLMPYEQAVGELKIKFRGMRKQFQQANEHTPIEFVTGRVKPVSSIIESKVGGLSAMSSWNKTCKTLLACALCANLWKIFTKWLTCCGSEPT